MEGAGLDARDVGGYDLIEKLSDYDKVTFQGSTALPSPLSPPTPETTTLKLRLWFPPPPGII
jgi:hypothetical protein